MSILSLQFASGSWRELFIVAWSSRVAEVGWPHLNVKGPGRPLCPNFYFIYIILNSIRIPLSTWYLYVSSMPSLSRRCNIRGPKLKVPQRAECV